MSLAEPFFLSLSPLSVTEVVFLFCFVFFKEKQYSTLFDPQEVFGLRLQPACCRILECRLTGKMSIYEAVTEG